MIVEYGENTPAVSVKFILNKINEQSNIRVKALINC